MKDIYISRSARNEIIMTGFPQQIHIELSWKGSVRRRRRLHAASLDCDLSCVVCDRKGQYLQGVNGQVPVYGESAVRHHGDRLSGGTQGEQVDLDLSRLPERVGLVSLVVNVCGFDGDPRDLGMLDYGEVRATSGGETVFTLSLTNRYDGMEGLIVGEFVRRESQWSFRPLAQPVRCAPDSQSMFRLYA